MMMPVMAGTSAVQVLLAMNPAGRIVVAVSGILASRTALPKTGAGIVPCRQMDGEAHVVVRVEVLVLPVEDRGHHHDPVDVHAMAL